MMTLLDTKLQTAETNTEYDDLSSTTFNSWARNRRSNLSLGNPVSMQLERRKSTFNTVNNTILKITTLIDGLID